MLRILSLALGAALLVFIPDAAHAADGLNGAQLSMLWALPFAGMLLCIATGPVLYPHFWEHHYGKIAAMWAALVIIPLWLTAGTTTVSHTLAHTALMEYIPFILLLLALFTVSGGIYLQGNLHDSVFTNTALLGFGTLMASVVGTTGASMILIRPLLRANDDRRYNVHVVIFFIFLVSNIGGSLSPLGDPPLFLGFLRGVDFFWTTRHIFPDTLLVAGIVLTIFMLLDIYLHRREGKVLLPDPTPDSPLHLHGKVNLLLLLVIIAAILMSGSWKSGISFTVLGTPVELQNLLRDGILVIVTFASLALTKAEHRKAKDRKSVV